MPDPIRVLLVEDSPVALLILKRLLESSPVIEVVGTAHNGVAALELIPKLQPTVICTDYHMPEMNGLEFTQQVMARYPRPILVISTSVRPGEDEYNVFRLLQAGAVDVFPKPSVESIADYDRLKQELVTKIKILSGVTVFTKHSLKPRSDAVRNTPAPTAVAQVNKELASLPQHSLNKPTDVFLPRQSVRAIVIGASTGGPNALHTILTQLPANLSVPVFCVQHISEGFLQGLITWLSTECHLPIKIAQAGMIPLPGTIYFAPERSHLELNTQSQFILSSTESVDGHRPSVTVLFKSAARLYGKNLIGILLTGMGRDGAAGMQDIALAGGLTIAQDEQSSVVFGMPKEAIALGAAKYVLPLNEIPTALAKVLT